MTNQEIIQKTAEEVKRRFKDSEPSHDWWHIHRVSNLAKYIQQKEGGDLFIIELGALLHDIGDWKVYRNDPKAGSKISAEILSEFNVDSETIEKVCFIVDNISFKGGIGENKMKGLEGFIVQDADRLDAIGAIGVARAFSNGNMYKEAFYDPEIPIPHYNSTEEYIKAVGSEQKTTVNHFYEKLLRLKDLMNTKTAKKLAGSRHKYMEKFLEEFFAEWEGRQ